MKGTIFKENKMDCNFFKNKIFINNIFITFRHTFDSKTGKFGQVTVNFFVFFKTS